MTARKKKGWFPEHWGKVTAIALAVIGSSGGGHAYTASVIEGSLSDHWRNERIRNEEADEARDAKDSSDRAFIMRQNDTIIQWLKARKVW